MLNQCKYFGASKRIGRTGSHADQNNTAIVWNAILMRLRKLRLQHPLNLPLAIHDDKNGETRYLMRSNISEIIPKAAKKLHPDLKEDEIMKFSAHSLRVWACVLLDEAGKKR